jgi:hypothetical protein
MEVLAGKLPLATVSSAIYPARLFWLLPIGTSVPEAILFAVWLIYPISMPAVIAAVEAKDTGRKPLTVPDGPTGHR